MEIGIYTESFKIRANEVDASGRATLPAICNLLQEVAGNHALELEFDITDLHKQNLTWVLHRMHIQMHSYPEWRKRITIETWPAAGDALRAYRDYRILDDQGKELGVALSYWMMINMDSRRPTRMPQEVLDLRLSGREHTLPIQNDRISTKVDWEDVTSFHVRKSDLDMNKHVNNVTYIQWICDACGDTEYRIKEMDIQFLQESIEGDQLICSKHNEANNCTYLLSHHSTNKALAVARIQF